MAARVPRGWVFTFGLAALAVAAGLVARTTGSGLATSPASGSALSESETERCIEYGRVECCLRLDEAY